MPSAVIARSDSDEAIHASACCAMDCFACARNDGENSQTPSFRGAPPGPRRARPDDRLRASPPSSFRDAPLGAGPESITTNVDVARSWGRSADDNRHRWLWIPGSRWRAPRNDEGEGCGQVARRARFRFTHTPNQWPNSGRPVPARGAVARRHERGTGCGGRDSVGAQGGRRAS